MDIIDALKHSAGKYDLLSPDQEILLGRDIQVWLQHPGGPENAPAPLARKGKAALDRFILCNQRLAIHIARRFQRDNVPLEDLVMAAMEGIILAAKRFDPSKGFRFSSYATWYATSGCQALTHQQGAPIKLSSTIHGHIRKILKANTSLIQSGKTSTTDYLQAATGLSQKQVRDALAAMSDMNMLRIDQGAAGGDGAKGVISPDALGLQDDTAAVETAHMRDTLRKLVNEHPELDPQTRYILKCRYLQHPEATIHALAQALNCSRERIVRLENKGLAALRTHLEARKSRSREQTPPLSAPSSRTRLQPQEAGRQSHLVAC